MVAAPVKVRKSGFLRRLRDCGSGIAMVEFAMSLPALLALGLVGMESAWFMLAHLRVSNIAMLTADNAARVRERIDEGDVNELFHGALMTGKRIEFEKNGRIILYSVEPNATNTRQWIRWQRCSGDLKVAPSYGRPLKPNGAAITNGTERAASPNGSAPDASTATGIGPVGNRIAAQGGTTVIVAEVFYDYQPLVSGRLLGSKRIHYISAFNVRQRNDQNLYNSANVTVRSCGA